MITPTSSNELLTPTTDDVVLEVAGVSKKFCRSLKRSLFYGVQDIATELAGMRQKHRALRPQEFWALENVSLKLRRGEALGLVGTNGSGKTTLLRIISGLIRPDAGVVRVKGRVAPLIALGAGFNPILTGRENVYANMSILGLSTEEIDERFDEVIEFAEIGDALDSPVHSYSSGMAARLGFACAIHTQPDILLMDEVLSVGDIKFRSKCDRKLAELSKSGTAFVIVSHYFQGILNLCSSAAYLSQGHLVGFGDARTIMDQYEQDLFVVTTGNRTIPFFVPIQDDHDSAGADITGVYFKNGEGDLIDAPISGQPTYFCVSCKVRKPFDKISIFLAVRQPAKDNSLILHMSSAYDDEMFKVTPGEYELRVYLPSLGLLPSAYILSAYLKDGALYSLDAHETLFFDVKGNEKLNRGMYYQARTWELINLK